MKIYIINDNSHLIYKGKNIFDLYQPTGYPALILLENGYLAHVISRKLCKFPGLIFASYTLSGEQAMIW